MIEVKYLVIFSKPQNSSQFRYCGFHLVRFSKFLSFVGLALNRMLGALLPRMNCPFGPEVAAGPSELGLYGLGAMVQNPGTLVFIPKFPLVPSGNLT